MSKLGSGSFATVYLVVDLFDEFKEKVAKIMHVGNQQLGENVAHTFDL